MTDRRRNAIVLTGVGMAIVSVLPTLPAGEVPWGWGFPGSLAVAGLITIFLGAAVDRAQPGHVVGRLFVVGGFAALTHQLLMDVAFALGGPVGSAMLAILYDGWMVAVGLWFTGVARFPEGAWAFRAAPWIVGWMWACAAVAIGLWSVTPVPPGFPFDVNPLGIDLGWAAGLPRLAETGFQMTAILLAVGHVVALRGASPLRRRQVIPFVVAVVLMGVVAVLSDQFSNADPGHFLATIEMVTVILIPTSIAVGITRYRLYEIDRLVSRSVTYAIVLAVMVAVYLAVVLVLGGLLPVEGDLPVAVATLAAVGVSVPLLRRVRRWVDRRFFRSRYDSAEVVARVADDLRTTVDLAEVESRAVAVVDEVFSPESVEVWLADGRR